KLRLLVNGQEFLSSSAATLLVTNRSCPLRSETVVAPKSLHRCLRAPSEVRLPELCLRHPDWFSGRQVVLACRKATDSIPPHTPGMTLLAQVPSRQSEQGLTGRVSLPPPTPGLLL